MVEEEIMKLKENYRGSKGSGCQAAKKCRGDRRCRTDAEPAKEWAECAEEMQNMENYGEKRQTRSR